MRDLTEISEFVSEIEDRHDIKKRIVEIRLILDCFKTSYLKDYDVEINYIDDAEVIITYFYYYMLEIEIKGYLDKNANIFKMASATELILNYVQPIKSLTPESKKTRRINAELSVYGALGFLTGWNNIDYYLGSGIEPLNDSLELILNERYKILENLDLESSLPILFNSQMWETFHLIHQYCKSIAMIN